MQKRIYHGSLLWIEIFVPRDHCSASLGQSRNAEELSSGYMFYPKPTIMIESYNLQNIQPLITETAKFMAFNHLSINPIYTLVNNVN